MQLEQLGPYRISRQIGRGGMGTVYQGFNIETGQPAAIKVLNPRLAVEEGFRERFETEIETLKKLKHPNIVRLYGFGEQEGHLYYAMELVAGTNLEDELQAGRRFTWRETTQLGVKLAKALKHAHDHGVIHRDLKPANLLLTSDDDIKLADFGIARLFGNTRLTSDGGLIGTAEYMAPEQADGRPVTYQCDLYSLGGVLFAMLAGRPPFSGGSLPEMLQYHRFAEPPSVARFAADVPPELERLIASLLSKDPQSRATNALAVARQLAAMEHALTVRGNERSQGPGGEGQEEDAPQRGEDADIHNADNLIQAEEGEARRPSAAFDDKGLPIVRARGLPDEQQIANAQTLPDLNFENAASGGANDGGNTSNGPMSLLPDSAMVGGNTPLVASNSAIQRTDSTAPGAISRSVLAADAPAALRAERGASVSRFITVEEDERRRAEEDQRRERGPRWLQIALLAASLVAIVALVVYLMRPPSADKLFNSIEAVAGDEKPGRLLDAEDDIRRFMDRFPDDPRNAKLKGYLEEIDLLKLERRMQRQLRASHDAPLAPIQRDYLEAISYSGTAPGRAIAKLQAIRTLYAPAGQTDAMTEQFLKLTQQQLKRLQQQSDRDAPEGVKILDDSLRRADLLRDKDPAAAKEIWAGIVELYADKPWASKRVDRAKAALANSRNPSAGK